MDLELLPKNHLNVNFEMRRYCCFMYIIAIINISGGAACTHIHNRSQHRRSESKPQARDRIHKSQHDAQTNEPSEDNHHELKNENHKLQYVAENLNQLIHQKGNDHKLKRVRKRLKSPDVKHPKHNHQSKHPKRKSHPKTKFSKDEDDEMSSMRNRTKPEEPDIKFPKTYHATGLLTLPYDGIMEPFETWYVEDLNMSRIDYYHGTLFVAMHHVACFKIIPVSYRCNHKLLDVFCHANTLHGRS